MGKEVTGLKSVKIYFFDHDIVAARSEKEAQEYMALTSANGCKPEEFQVNSIMSADTETWFDVNINGEGCTCPVCGQEFTRTTFREVNYPRLKPRACKARS